jgi:hypothetical protein
MNIVQVGDESTQESWYRVDHQLILSHSLFGTIKDSFSES